MMNNKMSIFWILACIAVIYLAVDIFGEGVASAYVAGIASLILTVMLVTGNKR